MAEGFQVDLGALRESADDAAAAYGATDGARASRFDGVLGAPAGPDPGPR